MPAAPADAGLACLTAMWALTLTAVAVRLARASTPEFVTGALFIGLGCVGGLALPWVWIHAGTASEVLKLAGGAPYIAGALFYHRRWPDLYPSGFRLSRGLHVYVCVAAACQYAAIARLAGWLASIAGDRPPARARRRGHTLPVWLHPLPGSPPLR